MKELTIKEKIAIAMMEVQDKTNAIMKRMKKFINKGIDMVDIDEDSDEYELIRIAKKSITDMADLQEAAFNLAIVQQEQINQVYELIERQTKLLENISENTNRIK